MSSQLIVAAIVLLGLVGQAQMDSTGQINAPTSQQQPQQSQPQPPQNNLFGNLPNRFPFGQQGQDQGSNMSPQQQPGGFLNGLLGNLGNLGLGSGRQQQGQSPLQGILGGLGQSGTGQSGLLDLIRNLLTDITRTLASLGIGGQMNRMPTGMGMGGAGMNPISGMQDLQGMANSLTSALNQGNGGLNGAQSFGRSLQRSPSAPPMNRNYDQAGNMHFMNQPGAQGA